MGKRCKRKRESAIWKEKECSVTEWDVYTYLLFGQSASLGSTVSVRIDPNVFRKDLVVGKGKSVVAVRNGRVQRGASGYFG
jgi:hypothetical protein